MNNKIQNNFIVIEGLDGSGTTTQLHLLDEELNRNKIPHYNTQEPTYNNIGRIIHRTLKREITIHARTLALLFAADRSEHLFDPNHGILSHIDKGELVICDRYLFSSLAYQTVECNFEYVADLNRDFPLPQHMIFIDTPISICLERRRQREKQDLFDPISYQEEVYLNYQKAIEMYRTSDMSIHCLEGSQSTKEIFNNIWKIIRTLPLVNTDI